MTTFRQELKSRFAALGIIVVLVLGVLLLRLWTMQVLQGKTFSAQAEDNHIRELSIPAPRGRILDRRGRVIVDNRAVLAVTVDPSDETIREIIARTQPKAEEPMTPAQVQAKLGAFSKIVGVPVDEILHRVRVSKLEALRPRVVALDVPMSVVSYLAEHESRFPYASVDVVAVRDYPLGALAAHVIGYTGEISESQLADPKMSGYQLGDIVGKAGAEAEFEAVLQGDKGYRRIQVDALGRPKGVLEQRDPIPGRDIRLSIDIDVQRETEKALAQALQDAHRQHFGKARAGAAVAVDVTTGEVVAMASAPTFDPSQFVGGISAKDWKRLNDKSSEYPLNNRAIMAAYPPASTFKVVTGLAGLQSGLINQGFSWDCRGVWTEMGKEWKKYCWLRSGHGSLGFTGAISNSCDSYFYEVGYKLYKAPGEKLQAFARSIGLGKKSGIDLPGEVQGRVPDKAWKKQFNADYPEWQTWLPGDTVNMAIGQGDMLVSPLQLVNVYAAVANGGKVLQPHVLLQVVGAKGQAAKKAETTVIARPRISQDNLSLMHTALERVTEDGTGRAAFRNFDLRVAGKTGTAQVAGKDDFAWFAGYAPADQPKYAVVVVVEQGGHGGSVAGPAGRSIFASLFGLKTEHVQATDASR